MRLFISCGDATVTENALRLVLDTVKEKHKLSLICCSRACPIRANVERWASREGVMCGTLQAQTQDVFWDMVDSVIALPGTPQSMFDSAKEHNRTMWEPFKRKSVDKVNTL